MRARRIAVLGAGPAGIAAAIGLRRAGEDVMLIGEPRRFAAVEGVSARVLEALRRAGFSRALACFAAPSRRCATWNGTLTQANWESLVERERFDRAALEDARAAGVRVVVGRALDVRTTAAGHQIHVEGEGGAECEADFVVEARGRAAPGLGMPRVRGAETVSLLQYWQGPCGAVHSAVESCADGWMWMAALADGRRYVQLTLDVAGAALPPKAELGAFCRARFAASAAAAPFVRDAQPVGEPCARTSTPVLHGELAGENWLRVGDAAAAVDPLSGNGIFLSLSSALQAPAVVGTLLHDPARAALAQRFHRERVAHLFYRFARIGRDFYAQEQRWRHSPFWQARRGWPDDLPAEGDAAGGGARIERRPVVAHGRVVEDEVVVTAAQPLGIWHLDGIGLAPLLRAVQGAAPAAAEAALRAELGSEGARAARIAAWMREQGWIA